MSSNSPLTFKIADAPAEFEQIHQLNYQTFAEEIPQHGPNPECRLMDRFHHENTYLICLDGDRLVGMMALRGKRPFSLDLKLENLDSYLPPGRRIVEVRLLSVARTHRNSQVLPGLLKLLAGYGIPQGYNLAIISGTVRQRKLYRHLGFIPFGPLVGSPPAQFQPMYLTLEVFEEVVKKIVPDALTSAPASTPRNG